VTPDRILILRTSALGDIVHSLPVLTALKRHYPRSEVGWVAEDVFAPLLERHPDIDRVFTVSLRRWRRTPLSPRVWREALAVFSEIVDFSPEIVLDLMGNHKAGVLGALTLCDRRIGHEYRSRREPSSAIWISEPTPARGTHVVDRTLSVLDRLGLPPEPADFSGDRLAEDPGDSPPLPSSEPFALLHPATGWLNKDYPPERWGRVVRLLAGELGVSTQIAPGPGEEEIAARVAAASGGEARLLSPVSLSALIGLQRRARLVLGGDTGPVHLAHALGTPVLCVMGPTDPLRNGPYGEPWKAVYHRLPCSFCHRRFDAVGGCLLEIPPETVSERAAALLC
jgi:heptosyltransferase-1